MVYKVIITPPAKKSLDKYIRYTAITLQNKEAAIAIIEDARNTKNRLAKIANIISPCQHPVLAQFEYRKIHFRKHDFFMVYRIEGDKVIVDGMFHDLQDFDAVFIDTLSNDNNEE